MIRPLPFADPDRLVKLWEDQSPQGYSALEPSPANYRDWKRMSKSFESMAAYRSLEVNLAADSGEPRHLIGASVNADLFPMLGAQAVLGRIFSPDDDRDGASGTLVLSYGLWKSQFGGDASVLGRACGFGRQAVLHHRRNAAAFRFSEPGRSDVDRHAVRGTRFSGSRQQLHLRGCQAWPRSVEGAGASRDGMDRRAVAAPISQRK